MLLSCLCLLMIPRVRAILTLTHRTSDSREIFARPALERKLTEPRSVAGRAKENFRWSPTIQWRLPLADIHKLPWKLTETKLSPDSSQPPASKSCDNNCQATQPRGHPAVHRLGQRCESHRARADFLRKARTTNLAALFQDFRAASPMNRAINSAAAKQR